MPEPLFVRACLGDPVERTPVWIMRQAGRYLPEYREIRSRHEFLACCHTPDLACEITLQPIRRLGGDAAILLSDILVPQPGQGVNVAFEPGAPRQRAVRTRADVAALRIPDPHEHMPFVLEAITLIRQELDPAVALIGFAGAPFTMATYLAEGGASKTFSGIKRLLFSDPEAADDLLRRCTVTVAAYLAEQIRAGADAVMLFDTWAGLLGPDDVRTFVTPYVRHVFDAVRQAAGAQGRRVPRIYYAGQAAGWIESCTEIGADVVGGDWRIALDATRERIGANITLQGNLDPAVLLGDPASIRRRTGQMVELARGGDGERAPARYIANLGHGILPDTPPEHAQLFVDTIRAATADAPSAVASQGWS
jgi:uroporphyrinogen decarboxylase